MIRPKKGLANPFDKIAPGEIHLLETAAANSRHLLLSDWRHTTSEQTWATELASGIESAICLDSLLINGKGSVNCWPQEQIDQFTNPSIVPVLEQLNLTFTAKG